MMLDILQKLSVAMQIVTLLSAEAAKLTTSGAGAIMPPEGLPALRLKTSDGEYELRLLIRRVR